MKESKVYKKRYMKFICESCKKITILGGFGKYCTKCRPKKYREIKRIYQRQRYKNNKYKFRMLRKRWVTVKLAIKNGKLKRPNTCSSCKRVTKSILGHHPDYNKPLKVMWLCHSCHVEIHRRKHVKL